MSRTAYPHRQCPARDRTKQADQKRGLLQHRRLYGFVYVISGPKGLGKKVLHFSRRLKPLKGKTRRRRVTKESDWRTYSGSCDALNADIARLGVAAFRFEILALCSGRSELTYTEIQEQVFRHVLRDPTYYNRNVGTRHYSALVAQTERSEALLAQLL